MGNGITDYSRFGGRQSKADAGKPGSSKSASGKAQRLARPDWAGHDRGAYLTKKATCIRAAGQTGALATLKIDSVRFCKQQAN